MQPARGRPEHARAPALQPEGATDATATPFRRSLRHAATGLVETWRSQRNFRIQVACAWAAALAACLLDLSTGETLAVAFAAGLVLAAELFNTALEAIVDLITKERHPLARKAKDAAAGAVLALSLLSLAVAALVFAPKLFPLQLRPHGPLWALPLALATLVRALQRRPSPISGGASERLRAAPSRGENDDETSDSPAARGPGRAGTPPP